MSKPTIFNFESPEHGCTDGGPFGVLGTEVRGCSYAHDVEQVSHGLAIFWGGEDLATEMYGQQCGSYCSADKMTSRDTEELGAVQRCIEFGIPMIGICRGAQLLCIGAGGQLFQHVDGHDTGSHDALDVETQKVYRVNSYHHQMMDPFPIEYETIMTAKVATVHISGAVDSNVSTQRDYEVIYFPSIRGLAIQAHPEWLKTGDPFIDYCLNLAKEKLLS